MDKFYENTSTTTFQNYTTPFYAANGVQDWWLSFLNIISQSVCVIGLILNILTIIAFAHTPKEFKNDSKLIVSLLVSDMLILFAVLLNEVLHDSINIIPACLDLFNMILTHMSYLATLLNLTMMALHLYFFTKHVFTYKTIMTSFKINCMVMLVWVLSIAIPLLDVFVGLAIMKPGNDNGTSQFCETITHDDFRTDNVITHGIFVVLIIMVIAYINIAIQGTRMSLSMTTNSNKSKTILTTGLFIFTFTIFWVPYGAFHLFIMYKVQSDPHYAINNIFDVLMTNHVLTSIFLLNSLADPIIYCLRLQTVRKGYKVFIKRILKLCQYYRDKRPYYTSRERRKTVSTTISGQDWMNNDDGSPTMINHNSTSSNHDDINATSVESKMILQPLDWVVPDTNGSLDTNTGSVCDNDT